MKAYLLKRRVPFQMGSPSDPPLFQSLIINNNALGNDFISVQFNKSLESPGANPLLGFSFEISPDGSTWSDVDLTSASAAINGDLVDVDLSGLNRHTLMTHHYLRCSYSSTTGDIRNIVGAADVASFGPTDYTITENNSTVDLVTDIEDYYLFSEASGTRSAEINGSAYDLADTNGVGVRTGASGSGNATDHTGTNYLSKVSIFDPPTDGKFTVLFYYQQDTLPSVLGQGDAYPVNRWNTNDNRSWAFVIRDSIEATHAADTMYFIANNSMDSIFVQHFINTGTLSNGTWYGIAAVCDPDAAIPIIGYTQPLNTPASFVVEDDDYGSPSSGDPQAKRSTGTNNLSVGDEINNGSQQGVDGGVDTLIKIDRALTEVEVRAAFEYYSDPSLDWLVDTV